MGTKKELYKKRIVLIILFVFAAAFLISSALSFQIEYYDTGVLQGLWPPSIFFVFSICAIFVFGEFKPKSLAIICSVYLILINLIPGLKYKVLYNSGDTMSHFALTRSIYETGSIPPLTDFPSIYVNFPAFHTINAIVSLVSDSQLQLTAEIFTFVLWGLSPIVIFAIAKSIGFSSDIQKFTVFASVLLSHNNKYYIASSMALFLVFVILCLLVLKGKEKTNRYNVPILILILTVPFTHHYTSLMLTLYLITTFMTLSIFQSVTGRKHLDVLPFALVSLVVMFGWWMYQANATFSIFAVNVKNYLLGAEAESLNISPFLTEVKYTPRELIPIILTNRPGTLITGVLSAFGLFHLVRGSRKYIPPGKTNKFLLIMSYVGMTVIVAIAYSILPVVGISVERTIMLGLIIAPIFSGIALLKISKFVARGKLALLVLLTVVFSITLVGYYPSEKIPYGFPTNLANSIYQEKQAEFVQGHLPDRSIAIVNKETSNRLFGFGGSEAYAHTRFVNHKQMDEIFLNFLGLETVPGERLNADRLIFLLHYEGKAGHKYQRVRMIEKDRKIQIDQNRLIDESVSRRGVDLIYDNGESFIAVSSRSVTY